jgi:hypothetical protein
VLALARPRRESGLRNKGKEGGSRWAVAGPREGEKELVGRAGGKRKGRKWSGLEKVVGLLWLRNRRRGAMDCLDFSPKEFVFQK